MAKRPSDVPDHTHDPRRAQPEPATESRYATTQVPVKAKTSAAAAFALIFGLSALICALALILSPLAILFGLIALILGIVGMKKARQPHVTGKGVAIGGLIMGVLGLLLGLGVIAGAATFLTNEANIARIETRLDALKRDLPTELPDNNG